MSTKAYEIRKKRTEEIEQIISVLRAYIAGETICFQERVQCIGDEHNPIHTCTIHNPSRIHTNFDRFQMWIKPDRQFECNKHYPVIIEDTEYIAKCSRTGGDKRALFNCNTLRDVTVARFSWIGEALPENTWKII